MAVFGTLISDYPSAFQHVFLCIYFKIDKADYLWTVELSYDSRFCCFHIEPSRLNQYQVIDL